MLTLYNDFIVKTYKTKYVWSAICKQNRFQDIIFKFYPYISQILKWRCNGSIQDKYVALSFPYLHSHQIGSSS